MTAVQALKHGLRLTHRNARLLIFQAALNAVAFGLFYNLLKVTDASALELALSLLLVLGILFMFSVAQAGTFGVMAQALSGHPATEGLWRQGVRNSWRFLLALLPVGLLGYLLFLAYAALPRKVAQGPTAIAFSAAWYGLLPLMLVALWASVANNGLAYSFKNGGRILFGRALRPRSILVYGVLFLLFGLLPYGLLALKTPSASPWLELAVFAGRVGVAYLLMVYGWTVLAGAMAGLLKDEG